MVEIKYVESISLNLLHLTFADKEIMCLRCHYLKLVWSHNFCHNLHVYYLIMIHLRMHYQSFIQHQSSVCGNISSFLVQFQQFLLRTFQLCLSYNSCCKNFIQISFVCLQFKGNKESSLPNNEVRKTNLDAHKRIFKMSATMKVVYQFSLVWFGLVWFGLVWFGLVWFGLVQFTQLL